MSSYSPRPSARRVILVNGIPASGKSTQAQALARHFSLPILSLDTLKEPFMQQFAPVDRAVNRQLGCAAYQAIWHTVSQAPAGVVYVIDAWFGFQPREALLEGLRAAGVSQTLEVWMDISADLAVSRYQSRLGTRLPGHPGEEYLPELRRLAESARPMATGPVWHQDAQAGADDSGMLAWVAQQPGYTPAEMRPTAAPLSISGAAAQIGGERL